MTTKPMIIVVGNTFGFSFKWSIRYLKAIGPPNTNNLPIIKREIDPNNKDFTRAMFLGHR
jgi:hypothetical protein